MNIIYRKSIRGVRTLALAMICLLLFMAGMSYSATVDVYLRADTLTVPGTSVTPGIFGNQAPVTMWVFADCGTDTTFTACTAAIPGPAISAADGDTLNIHVRNNLTGLYVEPTSVIIPGQTPGLTPGTWPTWTDGTTGHRTDLAQRVRSFTVETPADNATEVVYTWPNVKAGTYLYQSGTHPAIQVQMGLYGALRVYSVAPVAPATSGQAYADPSTAFSNEVTLLFSEIDPALHDAIANGTYGPGLAMTSTVNYHPKYFLIDGAARDPALPAGQPSLPGGSAGQQLLIRFLNAGLEPKVPVVQGPYMSVIAEDGNFLTAVNTSGTVIPVAKRQYSVLLPPGKTMDAIITPTAVGNIPVYDRRLNLTNMGVSSGGMLTYLSVESAAPAAIHPKKPKKRKSFFWF